MLRNTLNTVITATLIMLLGVSSSAQAIVPMGNLIGTTSVTWDEETASEIQTSIQSILVPAPPILSGPDDLPSISGASLVDDDALQYTITSNANGVDTYTLTLEIVSAGVEDAGVPVVVGVDGGMVTLGATAAMEAANADADAIKVPSDGVIDNAVNGITNGDTVIINDNPYTVGVVDDDGNTASIPLTSPLLDPLVLGDRIAERQTFAVSLDDVGTIIDGADTGTVTITVTATSTSPEAPEIADEVVVINLLTPVGPSAEKYVRNVTSEDSNPPQQVLQDDEESQRFAYEYPPESKIFYWRSQFIDEFEFENTLFNVEAEENQTLEYLIVLKAGNQEDQTGITLNETLSPFVEYVPESARLYGELGSELGSEEGEPCRLGSRSAETLYGFTLFSEECISSIIIAKNTSAYVTYKVKVIGVGWGEGRRWRLGRIEINNDTYLGCLAFQDRASVEGCLKDGVPWVDVIAQQKQKAYTACWSDGPEGLDRAFKDEGWVVGNASLYRYEPEEDGQLFKGIRECAGANDSIDDCKVRHISYTRLSRKNRSWFTCR